MKNKIIVFACIIIFLFVLYTIIISIYKHPTDFLIYYNKSLETLSFCAVITSVIFVIYQAEIFVKDYKSKREREEFDTSYKMAKYYADNIIPNLACIEFIFPYINKKIDENFYNNADKFKDFTAIEAKKIFGEDIIERYQKEINNLPEECILSFEAFSTGKTTLEIKKEWKSYNFTPEDKMTFFKEKRFIIMNKITYVINNIEYFAMYFCSGLAIPENVYMSLHQTYIHCIIGCYLFICNQNRNIGHEFYTHTISLYLKWKDESTKRDKKRIQDLEKITQREQPKRRRQ